MENSKVPGPEEMMRIIQDETLLLSGLTYDRATALYGTKIDDDHAFIKLGENFYERVCRDNDEGFRSMFLDKPDLGQNIADYLIQMSGGANHYTMRSGVVDLSHMHCHLPLTDRYVERWLHHMEEALDDLHRDFKEEHRVVLLDFMRYNAYRMLVYRKHHQHHMKLGPTF